MQLPPEAGDTVPMDPYSYPPPNSEQSHPFLTGSTNQNGLTPGQRAMQNYSLRPAPAPATPGIVLRSHTMRAQKWFIALVLLLTVSIVVVVPFLTWKFFFFSAQATNVHSKTTAPVIDVKPTSSPTPLPMGTTILPSAGKIMTGVSLSSDVNDISPFEQSTGKDVSILLFNQDWGAVGGTQSFPSGWATSVREHGSIPMVTWQPWITETYPQGNNEPAYALKNIIAGHFDTYIKQWAQDAKAWRNPFFLRFALEMNGDWSPWSEQLNGNKAGEFVRAWRHVHDIFTSVGATNVTWVWNPNVNYSGSTPLRELYPGDTYVDWMAIDGFNWGTQRQNHVWLTFSQVYGPTYNEMLQIAKKPIMLAQTASAEKGGNKAAWITDAYTNALPNQFPDVRAVVWFNQVTQEDWRVNSSSAALSAFTQAMRSPVYAGNSYTTYNGG